MQDLFSVILRSDRDGDNVISEKEMNQFVLRMKHYAGTRKFGRQQPKFNEQAVREAFSKSLTKTVQSLINVTASMADDDGDDYDEYASFDNDEEMNNNSHYGNCGYRGSNNNNGQRRRISNYPPGGFEGSSMNPVDVTNFEPPKDDVILDGL